MTNKARSEKAAASGARYRKVPLTYWPSHTRFVDLISYCTQGISNPVLQCGHAGDHAAETVDLHLDDVDSLLWTRDPRSEGPVARVMLQKIEERIFRDNDLQAAEILYAIATEAALGVLNLYIRKRELFNKIAPRRNFLPSIFSIHPNTAKVTAQMLADS